MGYFGRRSDDPDYSGPTPAEFATRAKSEAEPVFVLQAFGLASKLQFTWGRKLEISFPHVGVLEYVSPITLRSVDGAKKRSLSHSHPGPTSEGPLTHGVDVG